MVSFSGGFIDDKPIEPGFVPDGRVSSQAHWGKRQEMLHGSFRALTRSTGTYPVDAAHEREQCYTRSRSARQLFLSGQQKKCHTKNEPVHMCRWLRPHRETYSLYRIIVPIVNRFFGIPAEPSAFRSAESAGFPECTVYGISIFLFFLHLPIIFGLVDRTCVPTEYVICTIRNQA